MIGMLRGTVGAIEVTSIILDVSGIGFLLSCTQEMTSALHLGQETTVYTQMVVREDAVTLYGFMTPAQREQFRIVQSATGIGPKIALAMVSTLTPGQLRQAVLADNLAVLSKVPGVGRKVAQRLALELKDRVLILDDDDTSIPMIESTYRDSVVQGLENLGYTFRDASAAWDSVADMADDESTTVSDLMKAALRSLARG